MLLESFDFKNKSHIEITNSDISRNDIITSLTKNYKMIYDLYISKKLNKQAPQRKRKKKKTTNKYKNILIENSSINVEDVIKSLEKHDPTQKNNNQSIVEKREENSQKRKDLVPINTATMEELKQIKGLYLLHAKKIIQMREYHNYIESVDDLINKVGIKENEANLIKTQIKFDKIKKQKSPNRGRILDL